MLKEEASTRVLEISGLGKHNNYRTNYWIIAVAVVLRFSLFPPFRSELLQCQLHPEVRNRVILNQGFKFSSPNNLHF